jgi:glycosyltransferase involved in cell wall biosynthesis
MITVLIDTFYLKAAPAGIKTYIEQLVYSSKISKNKKIKYMYSHDINNNKSHFFFNSNNRLIRWVFQLNYLIWKQIVLPIKCLKQNPDILLCPDYVSPFWILNLKKVVVLHDSLFWKNREDYSKFWRWYYLKCINYGIDESTTIVTTSEYSKKLLNKVLRKKNNIEVIYQSCSKSKIKNKVEKNILHVGSFEKRKNLMTLVKAFLKIKSNPLNKDFKLILAGTTNFFGKKSEYLSVKNFIKENNIKKDVIITGYVNDQEKNELYSKAFLYVFPSNDEGFGIPIIEAFSNKLPVICSDIEVFNEIGNDSVLNFEKNNHNDLASKIELLINSDKLRLKLINKGLKRLEIFSNHNFISSYEKLFKSLK